MKINNKYVFIVLSILPPSEIKNVLLRKLCGWKIGTNVRIGISLITIKNVAIADGVKINHFNLIKGFNELILGKGTSIGKNNRFITNPAYSKGSSLQMGDHCTITSSHIFDMTNSIYIGDNVVIGGSGSQFWTHGFDIVRNRIEGPIRIEDDVYIGSACRINLGIVIGRRTIVGLGAVVTKSFSKGQILIGGNPAKIIHEKIILVEDDFNTIYRSVEGKNFFERISPDHNLN